MTTRKQTAVQKACARVEAGIGPLTASATDHVRAELPRYALVPLELHRGTVRDTIQSLLHALAGEGGFSVEDVTHTLHYLLKMLENMQQLDGERGAQGGSEEPAED